ncbi:Spy/CpxP family protein refolding chaperone [Candidatus Nitrospira salsa]
MSLKSRQQLTWLNGRCVHSYILAICLLVSACSHGSDSSSHYKNTSSTGHGDMSSYPNDSKHHESFHHGKFSPALEEELGLDDDQKETLHQMETDYRKMVISHNADIRALEVDLARILENEEPDRSALEDKSQAIGQIKSDLTMARIDSLLQLKEVLTKDQYEQFRSILRERMEGMEESPHH